MLSIVGSAITLATSICGLLATAQANANLNQLKNLELQLITEDAKGDAADDGLVESLHSQITVLLQAVANEYAQKTGAASAATS